jgi:hypothetical protein
MINHTIPTKQSKQEYISEMIAIGIPDPELLYELYSKAHDQQEGTWVDLHMVEKPTEQELSLFLHKLEATVNESQ